MLKSEYAGLRIGGCGAEAIAVAYDCPEVLAY
jgi:hypothetical protein